jgi:hypothetical protein
MSRAATLAKVAAAAHELASALTELAQGEGTRPDDRPSIKTKPSRRRGVRAPANPPIIVDELTAKKAEAALRRAGIWTR